MSPPPQELDLDLELGLDTAAGPAKSVFTSHLCVVRVPLVAILRTCPNMTLAVEQDVKKQL